jgi:hypothetical protein
MIQKFNFEQFEENNKMQMQTFLEEKMLDEEILLKSLRKEKLNYPLQLMLWIRSNMTNEVLVKVDQEVLDGIKLWVESGSTSVRTKIEEALLKDYKWKHDHEKIELSNEELKEVKAKEDYNINQLKKVYFLIYESIKLAAKIIVSNTENLWYLFMIIAHIENGTLLSMVYPISIFAYALLEESRPKYTYWLFMIIYTSWVLFWKYIFQSFPLREWISESFNNDLKSMRLGLHVRASSERSFLSFYIFEILILMFCIIHVLKIISIGLWRVRETDIENIEEAVHRLYQSQLRSKTELKDWFQSLINEEEYNEILTHSLVDKQTEKIRVRSSSLDWLDAKPASNESTNHLRIRLWKPTRFRARQNVCKTSAITINMEAKDDFEFQMGFKKRKRLYSQGKKIRKSSLDILDSDLYDKDGYLLPPKALTEYIYEEPTNEDCKEFVYKARTPKSTIK